MTLSDLSVRRPVLAAVANLLLIVFGVSMLRDVPVRELPDVDNAVVTVTTTYRGAAPEVIDTDITETIEGAVASISGIRSISSESRQGRSQVTIEFDAGRDVDVAANDVRDAVGRILDNMPQEADPPEVEKSDADADPVMRLAVVSDRMTTAEITDYVDRFIADRLATLDGVASLRIYGERSFAVRIWLDRRALAARKLTVADVERALLRNNVELPAGEVTSINRQLTVRLNSRLQSVEDFRDVVLDRVAGYPVRLGDVARVAPGVADDSTMVRNNGTDAVGLSILRQSQSNTLAISQAVRAEIAALKLITFGVTPTSRISSRSDKARSHFPAFSQAEMAALKLITFGVTPRSRIFSRSDSACSHFPLFSQLTCSDKAARRWRRSATCASSAAIRPVRSVTVWLSPSTAAL